MERKILEYAVISAPNNAILSQMVMDAIEKGYQPFESPGAIRNCGYNSNNPDLLFFQAVVKYEGKVKQ